MTHDELEDLDLECLGIPNCLECLRDYVDCLLSIGESLAAKDVFGWFDDHQS